MMSGGWKIFDFLNCIFASHRVDQPLICLACTYYLRDAVSDATWVGELLSYE